MNEGAVCGNWNANSAGKSIVEQTANSLFAPIAELSQ